MNPSHPTLKQDFTELLHTWNTWRRPEGCTRYSGWSASKHSLRRPSEPPGLDHGWAPKSAVTSEKRENFPRTGSRDGEYEYCCRQDCDVMSYGRYALPVLRKTLLISIQDSYTGMSAAGFLGRQVHGVISQKIETS